MRKNPSPRLYVGGMWLSLALIVSVAQAQPPENDDLVVERVVMLMRHGASAAGWVEQIALRSGRVLPDFERADFSLSHQGRRALEHWGGYLRQRLANQGLWPATGPLTSDQVSVYASALRKTRGSARALIKGLSPGTELEVNHKGTQEWFEPYMDGLAETRHAAVRKAVIAGLGMPLHEAQAFYRYEMEMLEIQLELPAGFFSHKPWQMFLDTNGVRIAPLEMIDLMVDAARMRYASNQPMFEQTFGGTNLQATLARLSELRTVNFNATRHPRLLAARKSAFLLAGLRDSLMSPRGPGIPPVMVLVGHDTNLAAIRSVLGFNWETPDHLHNDIAPGGTLILERVFHRPSAQRFVRISYHALTLNQIRGLQIFDDVTRPFSAQFFPPPELAPHGTTLIPLRNFARLVDDVFEEIDENVPGTLHEPSPHASPSSSSSMSNAKSHTPSSRPSGCLSDISGTARTGHAPIERASRAVDDRFEFEALISPFHPLINLKIDPYFSM